ncbi:MAG: hypothetical protein ACLGH3_04405 [Actinomycetota bacterium]
MTFGIKMMAVGAALALATTACNKPAPRAASEGDPAPPAAGGPAVHQDPPAPPTGVMRPLPDAQVVDIATGKQVNASTLVPASKPVLVWFWAPH